MHKWLSFLLWNRLDIYRIRFVLAACLILMSTLGCAVLAERQSPPKREDAGNDTKDRTGDDVGDHTENRSKHGSGTDSDKTSTRDSSIGARWLHPKLGSPLAADPAYWETRPWPDKFDLAGSESQATPSISVASCKDFFRARSAKVQPDMEVERQVFATYGSLCVAGQFLAMAEPYDAPCITPTVSERSIFEGLPAEVAPKLQPNTNSTFDATRAWKQLDPSLTVLEASTEAVRAKSEVWELQLDWMIRADLDHDGDEDRIAILSSTTRGGTLSQTTVVDLRCDRHHFVVQHLELL